MIKNSNEIIDISKSSVIKSKQYTAKEKLPHGKHFSGGTICLHKKTVFLKTEMYWGKNMLKKGRIFVAKICRFLQIYYILFLGVDNDH